MLMSTDSERLLESGCTLAAETWADLKRVLDWTDDGVDRCYSHQIGTAHRDRLYEAVGIDPAKDFSTFDFLGNVGSVSLPLTMAIGIERDPPTCGQRIAMLGIGSGLSCIMLGVQW